MTVEAEAVVVQILLAEDVVGALVTEDGPVTSEDGLEGCVDELRARTNEDGVLADVAVGALWR